MKYPNVERASILLSVLLHSVSLIAEPSPSTVPMEQRIDDHIYHHNRKRPAAEETAPKCVIITGKEADAPGVFKNSKFLSEGKEAASCKPCFSFKSYSDVEEWLDKVPTSELAPSQPLLIVQAAHGVLPPLRSYSNYSLPPDANFKCDGGTASAKSVLIGLQRLSRKRRVGAVIESCFSDAILAQKLLNDQAKPEDPSIDNLCLWTTSHFGRPAYDAPSLSVDSLSCAKKKQNLQDVFAGGRGLLSSAPYEYAGITTAIKDGADFKLIDNIVAVAKKCPEANTTFKEILEIVSHPSIEEAEYVDLQKVGLGLVMMSKASSIAWINKANEGNKNPAPAEMKCLEDWLKTVEAMPNTISVVAMGAAARKFRVAHDSCAAFKTLTLASDTAMKGLEDFERAIKDVSTWAGPLPQGIDSDTKAILSWVHKGLAKLAKDRPVAPQPKKEFGLWELSGPYKIRDRLARSLVGRLDLSELVLTINGSTHPVPPAFDRFGAQALMAAFQCGSLKNGESTEKLDQRRQNACTKFVL